MAKIHIHGTTYTCRWIDPSYRESLDWTTPPFFVRHQSRKRKPKTQRPFQILGPGEKHIVTNRIRGLQPEVKRAYKRKICTTNHARQNGFALVVEF